MSAEIIQFTEAASNERALIVDVEGFEGPLDLLLTLAREQKVDLAKISILALANQYLEFIEAARQMRLELAADYLVMAAWLAYLKSRLLLPEAAGPGRHERRRHGDRAGASGCASSRRSALPPANCSNVRCLAATPSIAATRKRSRKSASRNGRRRFTIFSRPMRASGRSRRWRMCASPSAPCGRSLKRARRCERMVGAPDDWARLDQFLIAYVVDPKMRADRDGLEPRRDARTCSRRPDRSAISTRRLRRSICESAASAEPESERRQHWSRRDCTITTTMEPGGCGCRTWLRNV